MCMIISAPQSQVDVPTGCGRDSLELQCCSLGLMDLYTSHCEEQKRKREWERLWGAHMCPLSWTIWATVSAHIGINKEGLPKFSLNKIIMEKADNILHK